MFRPKQYRAKAAESAELLKHTNDPNKISEFQRSIQSFTLLAQNEDWLADNFDKMVRSREADLHDKVTAKQFNRNATAEIEKHILRCLGAAVIMQWKTIPPELQRELFDTAGSLGDVMQTVELRGQIARFLHGHKDQARPTDGSSEPNTPEEKA